MDLRENKTEKTSVRREQREKKNRILYRKCFILYLVFLNELQHEWKIKLGHGDESGTHTKTTKHDGVEGVDMVHGKDTHDRVVTGDVEVGDLAIDLLRDAGEKTFVGEHHPFRQTSCAGRKRKTHNVFWMYVHHGASALVGLQEHRDVQTTIHMLVHCHNLYGEIVL
jgi:hypothetical protein